MNVGTNKSVDKVLENFRVVCIIIYRYIVSQVTHCLLAK